MTLKLLTISKILFIIIIFLLLFSNINRKYYIIQYYTSPFTIKLNKNNFINLTNEINIYTTNNLINNLINFNNKVLFLYIDSIGGNVDEGIKIINQINKMKNKNISVNCIAKNALSMAFTIFQYCSYRYILHNSILLQHEVVIKFNKNTEYKLDELYQIIVYDKISYDKLIKFQSNKIGISIYQFKKYIKNTWIIKGKDNIIQNTADKIINISCDNYLINNYLCPL